jgi:hypothetical protein
VSPPHIVVAGTGSPATKPHASSSTWPVAVPGSPSSTSKTHRYRRGIAVDKDLTEVLEPASIV